MDLEIVVRGRTGAGKTVMASWLREHLHGRLGFTNLHAIVLEDEDPAIPFARAEELLYEVLGKKKVVIRTEQIPARAGFRDREI